MENQRRKFFLRMALSDLAEERSPEVEVEDPLQFLWAVSYSDLLMVLMSFFIVYFSFGNETSESVIGEISAALSGIAGPQALSVQSGSMSKFEPATSASTSTSVGEARTIQSLPMEKRILDQISKTLQASYVFEKDPDGVVSVRVDLKENDFAPGQYKLNENVRSEIQKLLSMLEPYREHITLTFIGHADESPVNSKAQTVVHSNMGLSTLRATSGVEFAIQQGFDPKAIWTEGFAEYGRNTRSLSIRIRERNISAKDQSRSGGDDSPAE